MKTVEKVFSVEKLINERMQQGRNVGILWGGKDISYYDGRIVKFEVSEWGTEPLGQMFCPELGASLWIHEDWCIEK